ncbi:hypothetical protein [Zhongshania sp.]|uniref:hypothetical protein n=1 Tax=Zhongshania sp. TaxID=1971902 RepID=UPI003565B1B7
MILGTRKLGFFRLDSGFISENYERTATILAMLGFVPLKVELDYFSDKYEYRGYSDKFKELEVGAGIPEYLIIVRQSDDGLIESVDVREPRYQ